MQDAVQSFPAVIHKIFKSRALRCYESVTTLHNAGHHQPYSRERIANESKARLLCLRRQVPRGRTSLRGQKSIVVRLSPSRGGNIVWLSLSRRRRRRRPTPDARSISTSYPFKRERRGSATQRRAKSALMKNTFDVGHRAGIPGRVHRSRELLHERPAWQITRRRRAALASRPNDASLRLDLIFMAQRRPTRAESVSRLKAYVARVLRLQLRPDRDVGNSDMKSTTRWPSNVAN